MELTINTQSFALIEEGLKTAETRLGNDPVLSRVQIGDTITIVNRENGRSLVKKVTAKERYLSSTAVVEKVKVSDLGPYRTVEEFMARMRTFQTANEEKEHGIWLIRFVSVSA